jgi:hypothetical protein
VAWCCLGLGPGAAQTTRHPKRKKERNKGVARSTGPPAACSCSLQPRAEGRAWAGGRGQGLDCQLPAGGEQLRRRQPQPPALQRAAACRQRGGAAGPTTPQQRRRPAAASSADRSPAQRLGPCSPPSTGPWATDPRTPHPTPPPPGPSPPTWAPRAAAFVQPPGGGAMGLGPEYSSGPSPFAHQTCRGGAAPGEGGGQSTGDMRGGRWERDRPRAVVNNKHWVQVFPPEAVVGSGEKPQRHQGRHQAGIWQYGSKAGGASTQQ